MCSTPDVALAAADLSTNPAAARTARTLTSPLSGVCVPKMVPPDTVVRDIAAGLSDPRTRPDVIRAVQAGNLVEVAGRVLDLRMPRHRLVWETLIATTETVDKTNRTRPRRDPERRKKSFQQ